MQAIRARPTPEEALKIGYLRCPDSKKNSHRDLGQQENFRCFAGDGQMRPQLLAMQSNFNYRPLVDEGWVERTPKN
jgi:hypothetical protein